MWKLLTFYNAREARVQLAGVTGRERLIRTRLIRSST